MNRLELDFCCSVVRQAHLPKLAELAKGNLAFAVGVMVLLMVMTVGYLPIVLPLLLPGVTVDPWQIARSLVLLMLLRSPSVLP